MTDKQLQKRVEKISDVELKDLNDEQLQNLFVSLGTIQNRVTKEYSDRLRLYAKQRYDFF